ncbi:hypothetical protein [Streptomyces sp. SID13031]|uniref:hypothetical protein n=1 Tax=Streptomyces sp. SID13031 TaxID=2706046 RepID=UPI0013C7B986|nr:hypothetical protein [Streptomyces sp. SID13031]NEA36217.1 hypothetical protein [Streptomyces sp. SID13031]
MRTEPMVVEGLAGPVVLAVNAFTGKHSVTVGGYQVSGTRRGNYTLPTADGRTVAAKLHSSLLDPHPSIEIAGVRYRTGPSLPVAVRVLVVLPLVLLVGGLIGGLIGAIGVGANLGIARGQQSTAVKSLLMIGVLILTVVVFVVLAAAVF